MKIIKSLTIAILTTSFLIVSHGAAAGDREEMKAQFDTDGDGKLSKQEKKAMRESVRAQVLEKFDADGDGELSEEERGAAKLARSEKIIAKFDTDGDNKLSAQELSVAMDSRGFAHKPPKRHRQRKSAEQ
jgi:Ca2+-binding EF-hand superfamily protein